MTPGRLLAVVLISISTTSCAATTYDTSISAQSPEPTTTVLPKGTARELLPQLVAESARLSQLIADHGDKLAALDRIDALWAAVRDEVAGNDRDIAIEIEAEIAKSHRAATFNRPGAADKSYRNLTALEKAYLASA